MQQHPLTRLSRRAQRGEGPLARLLRAAALSPVYQPIASLTTGAIFAHEALIRGPLDSPMHSPVALLKAAAQERLDFEFESVSALAAIYQAGESRDPGRLFVNVSARVLVQLLRSCGRGALLGVVPRMLVLEITEHERVADMDRLARVVEDIRTAGVSLALDDFGDGRSSLRLWSQIKPEFVKIDKYFTKDLSRHADKLKTIEALQQIATTFRADRRRHRDAGGLARITRSRNPLWTGLRAGAPGAGPCSADCA